MSCRHDLANGTCVTCYPGTGTMDPGPERDHAPNLDGPGAQPARCRFLYGGNGGYCYSAEDIVNERCRYHRIYDGRDAEVARVETQRDALFAEVRRLKDVLHAMEDPCGRCVDMALAVATYRDAAQKLRDKIIEVQEHPSVNMSATFRWELEKLEQATAWLKDGEQ